jgi:hypothetical protein
VADTLPGLEDEPADQGHGDAEDPDELEQQSGLGRGLAAIIPTLADLDAPPVRPRRRARRSGAEALLGALVDEPDPVPEPEPEPEPEAAPHEPHVPAPSAVRKLRDDLVGALLDGLANTMALDLCAYLHEGRGEAPHLFLQSPSLDAIGADRAYTLFDTLRVDLEAGRSDTNLVTAGFHGVSVATMGDGSRGLWALARVEDVSVPEREVATRFCRSFGRAVHQLDGTAAPTTTLATPARVQAHRGIDTVLAEVEVRIGDQIRPGQGRAGTRVEAITRAVLVAADRAVTFRYASEVAHEGQHAAVVLLEGRDNAVSLGSSLTPEAGGVATAQAAIRALDGLAA